MKYMISAVITQQVNPMFSVGRKLRPYRPVIKKEIKCKQAPACSLKLNVIQVEFVADY